MSEHRDGQRVRQSTSSEPATARCLLASGNTREIDLAQSEPASLRYRWFVPSDVRAPFRLRDSGLLGTPGPAFRNTTRMSGTSGTLIFPLERINPFRWLRGFSSGQKPQHPSRRAPSLAGRRRRSMRTRRARANGRPFRAGLPHVQ